MKPTDNMRNPLARALVTFGRRVKQHARQKAAPFKTYGRLLFADIGPSVVTDVDNLIKVFGVRNEVFGNELHFETDPKYIKVNGVIRPIECDDRDKHSIQLLLNNGGSSVGSVRLVQEWLSGGCPMEEFGLCDEAKEAFRKMRADEKKIAEVSRLTILRENRGVDADLPGAYTAGLVSLFMGIRATAKHPDVNINYLVAVVEQRLLNTMTRRGIPIEILGKPVKHRGDRIPIRIRVDEIEVPAALQPIYLATQARIHRGLERRPADLFADLMKKHPFCTKNGDPIQSPTGRSLDQEHHRIIGVPGPRSPLASLHA